MTIEHYLSRTTKKLTQSGITTARLDSLVLLEDELGLSRAALLAHPEIQLTISQQAKLNKRVTRRSHHEPLAYIRGKMQFYGRNFFVNKAVLVPRPETEAIIDLLKTSQPNDRGHTAASPLRIADVGTGSGCIGITAVLELSPRTSIDLYDISRPALSCAKNNVELHQITANYYNESLLSRAASRQYDIILANLPYVPEKYPVSEAVKHEPAIAVFAGRDGLDIYRIFWQQIKIMVQKPQHIITESLPEQHTIQSQLARRAGYKLNQRLSFAQLFTKAY